MILFDPVYNEWNPTMVCLLVAVRELSSTVLNELPVTALEILLILNFPTPPLELIE
jgi:hypothetical protein